MTVTPNLLGIFSTIYGSDDAMDIPKAVLVAVVGLFTVVIILAIIALFIKFIAFVFSLFTKKSSEPVKPAAPAVNTKSAVPVAKTLRGEVKLIDVDEETAAVVMALVSHNSGIPLDRLDFKSIKALEDK